jgi:lysozyme
MANKTLVKVTATIGAAATATVLAFVPKFEGMVLRGYKDPIGIVTACAGHTKTAVLGRPYTREQCETLLVEDLAEHAEGVASCVPVDKITQGQRAAFVSFAYNVGVSAFCGSTMARKARAGDVPGSCAELDKWVYAGGAKLRGLVERRKTERAICEGKIQ